MKLPSDSHLAPQTRQACRTTPPTAPCEVMANADQKAFGHKQGRVEKLEIRFGEAHDLSKYRNLAAELLSVRRKHHIQAHQELENAFLHPSECNQDFHGEEFPD